MIGTRRAGLGHLGNSGGIGRMGWDGIQGHQATGHIIASQIPEESVLLKYFSAPLGSSQPILYLG